MDTAFLAPRYLGWLLEGFGVTLALSAAVTLAALALGFLLAIARVSPIAVLRMPVMAFLSFFRNTPLLVQLFFWYFGLAALMPESWMMWINQPRHLGLILFDIPWPNFEILTGFLGLTLYSAAFIAEEFRAGIQGVAQGQASAARALGLSESHIWRFVILPQAVRNAFSPLLGQGMNIIKNSSLTMAIGLAELSYASRQVETETFRTFQAFGIATLLYILAIALVEAGGYLLRRRDPMLRAARS